MAVCNFFWRSRYVFQIDPGYSLTGSKTIHPKKRNDIWYYPTIFENVQFNMFEYKIDSSNLLVLLEISPSLTSTIVLFFTDQNKDRIFIITFFTECPQLVYFTWSIYFHLTFLKMNCWCPLLKALICKSLSIIGKKEQHINFFS